MQGRGAALDIALAELAFELGEEVLHVRNEAPQHLDDQLQAAAETPDDIAPRLDQFARVRCRCRRAPGAAPAEMTEQTKHQALLVDRLRHMVVHARRQAGFAVGQRGVGGHGQDRQPGEAPVGADSPGRLETIDIRHLHVHQHRVERHARLQHLLNARQPTVGEGHPGALAAQQLGGDLAVLLADGVDHVGGGEVARGDLVRVQPDAQRIVAEAEQLDVADAVEAGQFVLHVEHRVVRQVEHVVAVIRRGQVHDHGQVGRGLVDGDAEPGHFFRELRLGPGDAVLHLHLGVVQVGAEGEGDGQGQLAVGGRLGGHVEHVLHPGDRLFQGRGDGLADDFRVGAGEVGADHDGRRHHFRVFADG
ncbi:hypothetical protein ALP65_04617 [Pseudomonas aeruginosa]|uniref:Uncharacterized protein n=1 Tax=Pseudomonas aeruginosa TaxID=287 RepID=A0A3M5EHJ1_PSEAI|nr:hypothetical protein ALP65_04617 [Pseudomonas aeruginosa]